MLGDRAEFPVLAPEVLQVPGEGIEPAGFGHDPGQCVHQPVALGGHRNREQVPRLRVAQEQIGVEEQRHSVTVHGHAGEGILETLDVQAAPSSRAGARG